MARLRIVVTFNVLQCKGSFENTLTGTARFKIVARFNFRVKNLLDIWFNIVARHYFMNYWA